MTKEQKEQKRQELKHDLETLTETEVREKWKIGKSLYDRAKKKLQTPKKGRKRKLDFLD
jgi:hypothetical protein